MRTGRKAAIIVTAWALVLTQAVPAAWAAGSGKGAEQKAAAQQKVQEQKDSHATETEKSETECQAPADGTTTAPADGTTTAPADGTTTAPADGTTTAPADGTTTAPADGTTTAPADGTTTAPADGSTTTSPCSPKANVNLTGRGQAAQHNPNVDANGQLVPGTAGQSTDGTTTTATAAATEQAKTEQIAKVKAESRTQAQSERAKGEKSAYLVYVNGERLNLTPLEHNGRTLVPFRMLSEFLGATVSWEQSTKTITMVKDGHTVVFSLGSTTATVDGQTVEMQVAPELVNDSTTFVPLRFIAEALGADVDYDATTGAITVITTPAAPAAPADGSTTAPSTGDTTTAPAPSTGDTTTAPAPSTGDTTTAPAPSTDSGSTTTAPSTGTTNP